MAISITVTNKVVGEGRIYPELGQRGRALKVPQYKMIVRNDFGSQREFSVTRDTVDTIKNNRNGKMECPASKKGHTYLGVIRKGNPKGFRIELHERGVPKKGEAHGIRGDGSKNRYNMQIHLGPAKSEGCILLAGWKRGRDTFERVIGQFMEEDQKHQQPFPKQIYVTVKKR